MPNNNYFVCGHEAFFFNDRAIESIRDAYEAATVHRAANGPRLRFTVYRRPAVPGEWDKLNAVEEGVA